MKRNKVREMRKAELAQAGQEDQRRTMCLHNLHAPNPKRVRYRAALRPDSSCEGVRPGLPSSIVGVHDF